MEVLDELREGGFRSARVMDGTRREQDCEGLLITEHTVLVFIMTWLRPGR